MKRGSVHYGQLISKNFHFHRCHRFIVHIAVFNEIKIWNFSECNNSKPNPNGDQANENLKAELAADAQEECAKIGGAESVKVCENHPQGVVLATKPQVKTQTSAKLQSKDLVWKERRPPRMLYGTRRNVLMIFPGWNVFRILLGSNHQQHQSMLNQKLVNQKQALSPHKLLLNRKVNTTDQSTSKLQAPTESLTTTIPMPHAPCTDANSSEAPVVSSDNVETQMSPPQIKWCQDESEHSGPTSTSYPSNFRWE
ncbi:HAS subgroup [Artemisia annua]|uniref:HAS subgroup n=1 Tax=Artemisia annua TaxID=35608 RepID=A0A2U1NW39_ARTAN|nr:HAS subgroup [Artemisia annua]